MIGNPGSILTVSSGRIAPLLNPLTPLRLFLFLIGVSLYPRLILHNYLLWGGLDDKMSSEIDPEKGVEKKRKCFLQIVFPLNSRRLSKWVCLNSVDFRGLLAHSPFNIPRFLLNC